MFTDHAAAGCDDRAVDLNAALSIGIFLNRVLAKGTFELVGVYACATLERVAACAAVELVAKVVADD